MVQINGLAEGFASGMDVGTNFYESRTKRQVLEREQMLQKLQLYEGYADEAINGIVAFVGAQPNRTNPAFAQGLDAMKGQVEDTAKLMEQVDPTAANRIRQKLNNAVQYSQTASEKFIAEKQGQIEGARGTVRQLMGGQTAPQAAPAAPAPAPTPNPTGASPMMVAPPGAEAEASAAAGPTPVAPVAPAPQAAAPQQQFAGMDEDTLVKQLLGIKTEYSPYDEKMQEKRAESDIKAQDDAREAIKFYKQNLVAQDYLDKGMFTGFGAGAKKEASKALGLHSDAVANTEAFSANRIMASMRLLKQMGAGTGLSDADRAAAEAASGGNIDTSEEGLRNILEIEREMIQDIVDVHNQRFPDQRMEGPGRTRYGKGTGPAKDQEQNMNLKPGKDGWIDLGGGIRVRQKGQ